MLIQTATTHSIPEKDRRTVGGPPSAGGPSEGGRDDRPTQELLVCSAAETGTKHPAGDATL